MNEAGTTDRTRLLELPRGRVALTAYVGRFGRGSIDRRTKQRESTVLLRRLHYSGQMILDHQWFRCGRWSENLSRYDIVMLRVRGLERYTRGYVRNGERTHEDNTIALATPIRADIVRPQGFCGCIVKALDRFMVEQNNFDIESVCKVLNQQDMLVFRSTFQQSIRRLLVEFTMSDQVRAIVAGYMTNRLHQYGSLRVNSLAIRRAVEKTYNHAKVARRQGAAHNDDVGARTMSDNKGW